MEYVLAALVGVLVVLVVWLLFRVNRLSSTPAADPAIADLKEQMAEQKGLMEGMSRFPELVANLQSQVTELAKIPELFRNPSNLRDIGESSLQYMLENVVPKGYVVKQHQFPGGGTVDSALNLDGKILPIDSKFPKFDGDDKELARNLKKRIEETSKYVRPKDGTTDFALMYVPSESLYIRGFVNNPELPEYARERKVVPVSPNTMYLYLATVSDAIRRYEFASAAGAVLDRIKSIIREFEKSCEFIETAQTQVSNAATNVASALTQSKDALRELTEVVTKGLPETEEQSKAA